jgi:hypothetical protein
MADLAGALDAALRDRYRVDEVKTPPTQRRGLIARMTHLERKNRQRGDTAAQAAARAAQSAGIAPDTWRIWRKGTRKPTARSLRKLEQAYNRQITLPKFRQSLKDRKVPKKVNIRATIRWTSSPRKMYNATKHRKVEFTDMGGVMAAVIRAWAGAGPAAAAEAFERLTSELHKAPPDDDGTPGIKFEGDEVTVEFP